jgi:hypothetical protein
MKAEITDSSAVPAPEKAPAKRGPGKPKGHPKSGGRKKGTPNHTTAQTRDRIQQLADPIDFLADVMNGRRMVAAAEHGAMAKTWVFPTLAQRIQAGETLLRKLLPDLRSQELTGKDGEPLIKPSRRDELYSSLELARRTAYVLAAGDAANQELAVLDAPRISTESQPVPEPETATKAHEPRVLPTEPPPAPLGDPKRRDRALRPPERF